MIFNEHSRVLPAPIQELASFVDSPHDRLWPRRHWPAMRFEGPLDRGVRGGHGPIRYVVEEFHPGREIVFRFTGPRGFVGTHRLTVESLGPHQTLLRHTLEMKPDWQGFLKWHLFFGPLHDALLEDALDQASTHFTGREHFTPWSRLVRLLRWFSRYLKGPQRGAKRKLSSTENE